MLNRVSARFAVRLGILRTTSHMWSDTEYAVAAEPADLNGGLGSVLAVSPHLADAVAGCADLLGRNAGSLVVTVFAGSPSAGSYGPQRNRRGVAADAAFAARQEEDLLALYLLDASPVWLEFSDSHDGPRPRPDAIIDALAEQIARHSPDSVVFPLGLGAEQHRLVADACLRLCAGAPARRWIAYADPCAHALARPCEPRRRDLRSRGFVLDPLPGLPMSARKGHAVDCYSRSPARDAPGEPLLGAVFLPEQYWQIRRHG